jgi:hypothetical protein
LRQAARADWGVPDRLKTEILYRLMGKLSGDRALSARTLKAIADTLAKFDALDLAAARLELARRRLEQPDRTEDARSAWDDLLSQERAPGADPDVPHDSPGRPGPVPTGDPGTGSLE